VNAYHTVLLPDNVRRVFKTDPHYALEHHHPPTIIQGVTIIINNIIVKTTIDLHHHNVMIINSTQVAMTTTYLNIIPDTMIYNDLGGYKQSYNRGGPPHRGMQPYRGAPRDNHGG